LGTRSLNTTTLRTFLSSKKTLKQVRLLSEQFKSENENDYRISKPDFRFEFAVLQRAGATCSGARSRFRAHNGCYLVLSTDWSCFVNPWTYRLEFVIGQHRVVEVGHLSLMQYNWCTTIDILNDFEIMFF
jgi:hypothetical protein